MQKKNSGARKNNRMCRLCVNKKTRENKCDAGDYRRVPVPSSEEKWRTRSDESVRGRLLRGTAASAYTDDSPNVSII